MQCYNLSPILIVGCMNLYMAYLAPEDLDLIFLMYSNEFIAQRASFLIDKQSSQWLRAKLIMAALRSRHFTGNADIII